MLTALLIAYSVVASNPADLIDRDLRRAGNEYAYGNYEEAILQLRELLYPVKLVTEEQVMEARELLALCYYLTNRIEQMGNEFSKLLYLDPDYKLDPFTVAPAVIEKFEQIRDRLAPDLDKLRRAQQGNPVRTAPGPTVLRTVEQTVIYRSDFATFLPFGIGQFQNGDVQMGLIFGITETLLLAANVGAYFMARYSAESPEEVQKFMVLQYGSAALFGVAWSLGVFQARLNFVPTVSQPPVITETTLPATGAAIRLRLDF